MRPVRLILASALLFVLLAGTASASNPDPKQMVLTLQDMPTGFSVSSGTGYKDIAAVAKTSSTATLAQYKAWGYQTGYEADFTGSPSLSDLMSGAADITSSVSVYKSSSGAEKSLTSSLGQCHKAPYKELSMGGAKLGDEGHLCSATKKSGEVTAQVYAVLWRHGRLKGSVLTAGVVGATSPTQAVTLAEVQDKRMG